VDEVGASEGTRDEGRSRSRGSLDPDCVSNVAEDVAVAEAEEGELAPVGMGGELCVPSARCGGGGRKRGRTSSRVGNSRTSQPRCLSVSPGVQRRYRLGYGYGGDESRCPSCHSHSRCSSESPRQVSRPSPARPWSVPHLHARSRINLELTRVDRTPQPRIDLPRIPSRQITRVSLVFPSAIISKPSHILD
jgi:hypothetical protein